jgi:hypothetical protein
MSPELSARYALDNSDLYDHLTRLIAGSPMLALKVAQALEDCASAPDDRDFAMLKSASIAYLKSGKTMPTWLRDFTVGALDGSIKPTGRRGRPKTTLERDFSLWIAVELVADAFGIQRYSNGESKSRSAVEIVAEVSGIPVDTVKHAIRNCERFVPRILGAENTP